MGKLQRNHRLSYNLKVAFDGAWRALARAIAWFKQILNVLILGLAGRNGQDVPVSRSTWM